MAVPSTEDSTQRSSGTGNASSVHVPSGARCATIGTKPTEATLFTPSAHTDPSGSAETLEK